MAHPVNFYGIHRTLLFFVFILHIGWIDKVTFFNLQTERPQHIQWNPKVQTPKTLNQKLKLLKVMATLTVWESNLWLKYECKCIKYIHVTWFWMWIYFHQFDLKSSILEITGDHVSSQIWIWDFDKIVYDSQTLRLNFLSDYCFNLIQNGRSPYLHVTVTCI